MIGAVYDRGIIRLEPVTKCKCRMIQIMRNNVYVADPEDALDQIMIMNRSFELIRSYGKVGVLHLPSERFSHGLRQTLRTVDVPFVTGYEKRGKERKTLDVIPMRVTDENMTAQRFPACRK
jgi:hypothetical protein